MSPTSKGTSLICKFTLSFFYFFFRRKNGFLDDNFRSDNSFNIIVKANGVGSEDEQTLVDVVNSNNATSEPKVSIADIHYEILGTGKCTIFFKNDIEKKVEIEGRGNYGLKPTEERIKDAIGDILLTSDSNVTSYNVVIEAQKESGYTS